MAFRIGNTICTALYIGTTPVYKIYKGTELIFDVSYITTQDSLRLATQSSDTLITQSSNAQ